MLPALRLRPARRQGSLPRMRHGNPNEGQTMKCRWIIRSFFILLILLCIGWGWSSTHEGWIFYHFAGGQRFDCGTVWSILEVGYDNPDGRDDPKGWSCVINVRRPIHVIPVPAGELGDFNNGFLGFNGDFREGHYFLEIPYWFLVSILVLILIFVWRKNRKPNPATAFPVETDKMKP